MKTVDLTKSPSADMLRSAPARGIEGKGAIDRAGGDKKAGLIRGFSVITRGEALGHGLWIDDEMLASVERSINEAGKQGVKARFTHPGLSNDGLGSFLGRVKNAKRDGDLVRADLHFSQSSHKTPDGDLAEYVMKLAEEDPASFGTSIVFRRDRAEEEKHRVANTTDDDGFVSPDKNNKQNLPHARLKSLYAVDAVDNPAANPSGMFHATDVPGEADSLLSYALGLTNERPQFSSLPVDPDRAAGFVNRFLQLNNLEIKEKEMAEKPQEIESLKAEVELLKKQNAELSEKLSTVQKQQATDEQSAAEQELNRRAEVDAVCRLAKVDEDTRKAMHQAKFDGKRAQDFLSKSGYLSASNPPVSEGGNDPTSKPAPTKEDAFGSEWDAHRDVFERQGVSREQYIKSRMKD